jgi:hypothetical protein
MLLIESVKGKNSMSLKTGKLEHAPYRISKRIFPFLTDILFLPFTDSISSMF